jgi:hypothetical protein
MSARTIKRFPRLDFAELPYEEQRRFFVKAIRKEIAKLQGLQELRLLTPAHIASILKALLILIERDGGSNGKDTKA